jgi:chaperone required for assembly of F1-ATPase
MMLKNRLSAFLKSSSALYFQRKAQSSLVPTIHQKISGRRRFYKLVDVARVDGKDGEASGFKITLDGRTLKTPAGNVLLLPNETLAYAIAAEWDAQEANSKKGIQPPTMPLMILASTAIDQILPDPTHVRNTCMSYLPTDTALFLTRDEDRILLKKQRQHFQPVLRWFGRTLGLDLQTTQSMSHRVAHPEATIQKMKSIVYSMVRCTLCPSDFFILFFCTSSNRQVF